ncbi:MAG: HD domain-containing protein [Deltaproteobacteria bacterium]|nr:HD domain-containing protein [Deltaproteobacteria bacterium]
MTYGNLKPVALYLLALVVMIFYGGQVCPFLESLTVVQLVAPIAIALTLQFAFSRWVFHSWIIPREDPLHQPARRFHLEMGLFLLAGLGVGMFNFLAFQFPVESGLKVVLGFTVLGFFTATLMSLDQVAEVAAHAQRQGTPVFPGTQGYLPLPFKLSMFVILSVVLSALVLFLVVIKDLDWLNRVGTDISPKQAQRAILSEFGFVIAVILGYVVFNVLAFTRNLSGFFAREQFVLEGAAHLRFDDRVPVASNDEFGQMAHHTNQVVSHLQSKTRELFQTRDATIHALASLAETRDNETGRHILRTQRYVRALAEALRTHPDFGAHLDAETVDLMFKSAPLHDIGKVGIPDHILLKPGKLTPEEFEIMKTHPRLGSDALEGAVRVLGENSFLRFARDISLTHHENWDGSGYPQGLRGEAIPLSGRLMALADVYDALISKRVYKPAFPHDKAVALILEQKGTKFDPRVVAAFESLGALFQAIASELRDPE